MKKVRSQRSEVGPAKTIVCQLLSEARYVVPGSTIVNCGTCGKRVWMSPSSLGLRMPLDRVLCLPCFHHERETDDELIELLPFTERQRREIDAVFAKGKKGKE